MPPRLPDIDLVPLVAASRRDRGRRAFLVKARRFAVAGVAAACLSATLIPNFAAGQQVPSQSNAQGQTTAAPVRVRGVIQSSSAQEIVVKVRSSEELHIALAPGLVVNEVYPIELSQ